MLRTFTVATAVAGLLATASGCAAHPKPAAIAPAPPSAPSPKPADALAAAVTKTTGVNLKLVIAMDEPANSGAGVYEASSRTAAIAMKDDDGTELQWIFAGTDVYLVKPPGLGGRSVHLETAKMPTDDEMALVIDPVFPLALLPAAVQVESTGTGAYKGVIDLAAVRPTPAAKRFVDRMVTKLGAKANVIDFSATVGGQGYLTSFRANFPGLEDGKIGDYSVTLSDFGTTAAVTRPAAKDVVEAPEEAYKS